MSSTLVLDNTNSEYSNLDMPLEKRNSQNTFDIPEHSDTHTPERTRSHSESFQPARIDKTVDHPLDVGDRRQT